MKHLKTITIAILIVSSFAGTAYIVQAKNSESENVEAVTQAKVSLNKAIEIALQQIPGNVVSVEFENDDGQTVWEVEVLAKNSEVNELKIDANSGEILKHEKEDNDDDEDDDK
ncbi:MAG: hypothetical protein NPINA01_07270 [Nitrospinaceae bacterium]|nr:MAG: hypothetical protein NPINA01_07270 [Nitrospinaceae bacterium]